MELTKLNSVGRLRRDAAFAAIIIFLFLLVWATAPTDTNSPWAYFVIALVMLPTGLRTAGLFYSTVHFNEDLVEVLRPFRNNLTISLRNIVSMHAVFEPHFNIFNFPYANRRFKVIYMDSDGKESYFHFSIQLNQKASNTLTAFIGLVKFRNPAFSVHGWE